MYHLVMSYRFTAKSFLDCRYQYRNDSSDISLTITSPPYWNAIDYDVHSKDSEKFHRTRDYSGFGGSYEQYLKNLEKAFTEVWLATKSGGFCAVVIGTVLHNKVMYPLPMDFTKIMCDVVGWEFHQDIIWNKVTGGVKRAGSFIQRPHAGYYYPNIMTEYILVFRKHGDYRRGGVKEVAVEDDLFKKDIANNIWHIAPVPPKQIDHPCPFPKELVRRLLLLYSRPNDVVLDPFLGSGQTAVVAVQHKRKCVGYDIEPKYIKLATHRMENLYKEVDRKYNLIPKYEKV